MSVRVWVMVGVAVVASVCVIAREIEYRMCLDSLRADVERTEAIAREYEAMAARLSVELDIARAGMSAVEVYTRRVEAAREVMVDAMADADRVLSDSEDAGDWGACEVPADVCDLLRVRMRGE